MAWGFKRKPNGLRIQEETKEGLEVEEETEGSEIEVEGILQNVNKKRKYFFISGANPQIWRQTMCYALKRITSRSVHYNLSSWIPLIQVPYSSAQILVVFFTDDHQGTSP
jgi:hypothetical protein